MKIEKNASVLLPQKQQFQSYGLWISPGLILPPMPLWSYAAKVFVIFLMIMTVAVSGGECVRMPRQ